MLGGSYNLSFGPQELIKRCLETHNQLFLIAEVDGRIVGNLTFEGVSDRERSM